MCGRFYVDPDALSPEWAEMINHAELRERKYDPGFHLPTGEIRPGDAVCVLAPNRERKLTPFAMRWGFQSEKKLIFNARSETAAEKPMFRASWAERRCLIPGHGYYEWDHSQAKPPKLYIRARDGDPLYFCGLYRLESGRPSFTILTREPTAEIAHIHDRMPLMIRRAEIPEWLECGTFDPLACAFTSLAWSEAK